jgi:hypothetical protein
MVNDVNIELQSEFERKAFDLPANTKILLSPTAQPFSSVTNSSGKRKLALEGPSINTDLAI